MRLPQEIVEIIRTAGNKALATVGADGPNVVPVSMVALDGEEIIVSDCFMDKTRQNVQADPRASLSFWQGFDGVQIKGTVAYEKDGDRFGRYAEKLAQDHPGRQLCGVLVFTPEKVYDLSPKNAGAVLR